MKPQTKVWDIFIRFFHWSLVFAFLISYLTEGETNLHFYSGWYIVSLIALRVIWGFIGTKYARFSEFIKPPSEVINYSRSLISFSRGTTKHYLGHNPLGGLMVVALLIALSLTCFSGVMTYTAEGQSPFTFVGRPLLEESHQEHGQGSTNYEEESESESEEFWEEIHEFFVNVTLILIIIHIAGVLITSWLHNEKLIKAMITGKK